MHRQEARELLELAQHEVPYLGTYMGERQIEEVIDAWERRHGLEPEPRPKARRSDPATSQVAAALNEIRVTGQRARLLGTLAWAGAGGTAEALAGQTGIPLNSVSTRLSEMERAGWIERRAGETRRTSAGASASVYRITTGGREALTTRR